MKADEIYQALKAQGYNASSIAEALDVRPQSVAGVIRDGHGSKRIAKAIAVASAYPLETMFPFYQEQGRKKAVRSKKINELKAKLAI